MRSQVVLLPRDTSLIELLHGYAFHRAYVVDGGCCVPFVMEEVTPIPQLAADCIMGSYTSWHHFYQTGYASV